MDDGPEKVEKEVERDAYKAQVWKDGALVPLRAWEASSQLACDKVEVKEGDEEGRLFHRFQCVMGECGNCPKWHNIVPSIESECDRAIRYATYSGYHTCPIPGKSEVECVAVVRRLNWVMSSLKFLHSSM